MTRHPAVFTAFCCLALIPAAARAQEPAGSVSTARSGRILEIGNLTWTEIDALSRDSTLFLLAVGMLEEHGPHLPIASDQIGVEYETAEIAARLSRALPGWSIVLMPPVPYGSAGANHIGGRPVHPGTYGIRQSTLRVLVADIGGQIAQNRFRWIFLMSGHAAPTHGIALNEACDFISEAFGVTMANVSALFRADSSMQRRGADMTSRHFSRSDLASFGRDVHAGVAETSGLLAIRPDLVRPVYRTLPGVAARTFEEMRAIAQQPGWQGYFSAPARATAAFGRDIEEWWVAGMTDVILRSVRGESMAGRPRYPGELARDPRAPLVEEVLAHEREFGRKLEQWLTERGDGE